MSYNENKIEAGFFNRKKLVNIEAGANITIDKSNPSEPIISATPGEQAAVTWGSVTGKPNTFTPATHTHTFTQVTGVATAAQIPVLDAAKITTGAFNIARIPTGTTATTVALGDHVHSIANITGLQGAIDAKYTLLAGGTATTYLRGDNTWATPTNTTYAIISDADATAGTATDARTVSATSLKRDIEKRVVTYLLGLPNAGAGKYLTVDAAGTGFEWVDAPAAV